MKPFARFTDKKEHIRRVNNILKEHKLRILINQLKYFKSQGLKTLAEIETHIEERKKDGKYDEKKEGDTATFIKNQKSLAGVESSRGRRRALQLSKDVQECKEFNQLNDEEQNLVVKINMMPDKFLLIKQKMIEENEKNGRVEEAFINKVTEEVGGVINPQQTCGKRIYNLLVSQIML